MKAVIIGSTGLTGNALLHDLLHDSEITQVLAISRKPSGLQHEKLREILLKGVYQLPSLESQIDGELFFCCLGTTIKAVGTRENFQKVDHDAILAFAKIAKNKNAKSFTLISSKGANRNSRLFYLTVKGQTETHLSAMNLNSLTIFRPAFLAGVRKEFRFSEKIAEKIIIPLVRKLPQATQKNLMTDIDLLARRMRTLGKAAEPGVHIVEAKDI